MKYTYEELQIMLDETEISTDDIIIEDTLCCLYDSMEENNIDIN